MSIRSLILGLVLLAPQASWAQAKETIRYGTIDLKGTVQKPEILVVITRQNLNSTYTMELKESFLPQIVESVDGKPF